MLGQSAFFNNGYIDTDFKFFNNNKSVTFMTWIKFLNCESESNSSILGQRNGYSGRVELFAINNKIGFYSPCCGAEIYSKSKIENDKWYNISLVLNVELKLILIYLNGNLEIQCNINDNFVNSNTSIGKYPEANYSLIGYMAEIKFYNYAMKEKDIKLKMNKKESKSNFTLLGYYNFENNSLDVSGKINNLNTKSVNLSIDFPIEITSNGKFLITQNNNYYLTKSNFINLGQPIDNTQLENWYKKYGADDVNIITQNLNNKEFPMSKDENGIWKTDFQLDMNEIIDNIQLIDTDENNKTIKYNCNDYRILDLCDDEFKLTMCKSK